MPSWRSDRCLVRGIGVSGPRGPASRLRPRARGRTKQGVAYAYDLLWPRWGLSANQREIAQKEKRPREQSPRVALKDTHLPELAWPECGLLLPHSAARGASETREADAEERQRSRLGHSHTRDARALGDLHDAVRAEHDRAEVRDRI